MANTVKIKRSSVQGKDPTTGDLELGELALNTYDGNLFFKRDVSGTESVVKVATSTNLLSYTRVTSNTNAATRQSYIADTSGGTFTITLPESPGTGDWVTIVDGASFQTTALTVGRNSSTIADTAENLSLNIEGVSVTLVYDGSTWEVFTQVGANGGDQSGLVTGSSTTTFTNKTISGSSNTLSNIGNSSLTNSSISINGTSVSLGGSVSSLVTLTGAETLTNKTLTTPTIATINAPASSSLTLTSPSGYDVVVTAGGNSTAFKQSGTIEPYGAISGSSYGSNYLDVTQLGSLVLGGELYGVTVRTSADRSTFYNYEFGTDGLLTLPGNAKFPGSTSGTTTLKASAAAGTTTSTLPNVTGTLAIDGPAFRAYPSTSQTITSGSLQKVNFGTETFDTNNNFASSRFTPTVEGYYQLNSNVRIDGSTGTGECMIVLYKNGSELARGWNSQGTQFAANFWTMNVSDIAYANGSTDYFEVYIQQGSGADRTTTAFSNISYFSGCMIRGA